MISLYNDLFIYIVLPKEGTRTAAKMVCGNTLLILQKGSKRENA